MPVRGNCRKPSIGGGAAGTGTQAQNCCLLLVVREKCKVPCDFSVERSRSMSIIGFSASIESAAPAVMAVDAANNNAGSSEERGETDIDA